MKHALLAICIVVAAFVIASRGGQTYVGWKDPQRAFSPSQRQAIFARAGFRCEHVIAGLWRCPRPAAHADHVWPHSRGGATTLANAQALCRLHNLGKSNHRPTRLYLWKLERSRKNYMPDAERKVRF